MGWGEINHRIDRATITHFFFLWQLLQSFSHVLPGLQALRTSQIKLKHNRFLLLLEIFQDGLFTTSYSNCEQVRLEPESSPWRWSRLAIGPIEPLKCGRPFLQQSSCFRLLIGGWLMPEWPVHFIGSGAGFHQPGLYGAYCTASPRNVFTYHFG